jgi:hypothetical protein
LAVAGKEGLYRRRSIQTESLQSSGLFLFRFVIDGYYYCTALAGNVLSGDLLHSDRFDNGRFCGAHSDQSMMRIRLMIG